MATELPLRSVMARSPHASYLNPKWGRDPEWMASIMPPDPVVSHSLLTSAGDMIVEAFGPASSPEPTPAPSKGKEVPSRAGNRGKKPVLRELPCLYLGSLVKKAGCGGAGCPRNDAHRCDKGLGNVTQNGKCETCNLYEADQ